MRVHLCATIISFALDFPSVIHTMNGGIMLYAMCTCVSASLQRFAIVSDNYFQSIISFHFIDVQTSHSDVHLEMNVSG